MKKMITLSLLFLAGSQAAANPGILARAAQAGATRALPTTMRAASSSARPAVAATAQKMSRAEMEMAFGVTLATTGAIYGAVNYKKENFKTPLEGAVIGAGIGILSPVFAASLGLWKLAKLAKL